MNILFTEKPLVVNPMLAKRIGLNESIVLQQINYWMQRSGVEARGRHWIYNTYEDWQEQFPFWSKDQIKRIFTSLKKKGVICVEQLKKKDHDRTNYYTINYNHESLQANKINEWAKSPVRESESTSSMGAKSPVRWGQSRPFDGGKAARSMGAKSPDLTEITTEITSESTTEITDTSGSQARPSQPTAPDKPPKPKKPKVKAKLTATDLVTDYGLSDQLAAEFIQIRKDKRLTLTPTAMTRIQNQATKAGLTLHDAIMECCANGWAGFKKQWLDNQRQQANRPINPANVTLDDIKARAAERERKRQEAAARGEVTDL